MFIRLYFVKRAGGDPSGWYIPEWTVEADKDISQTVGNQTAILTVTAPGPCIEEDSEKSTILARQCNEYVAALRDNDPSGYGFFASLPSLIDEERTLKEIAYAFDVLHADGVILFTRYGNDNHYLGHEKFNNIWAELNRREAVVFIHPTHAVDTHLVDAALAQPMFDYPHETGRAAMDLIVHNNMRDYPQCKIILSHAGGTLPYLIYRSAGMLPFTPQSIHKSTEEIVEEGRQFYFDTAISANPVTLKALFEFAKPDHILFGTDFPNAPSPAIVHFTENLERYEMPLEVRKSVNYGGALKLIPRLAQYYKNDGDALK
ncbi:hypothetical protein MMC14_008504 [Varicellaria rhodocarpa]|nr:hypothetical protein [Varicellaria rhodocarpa]